MEGGVGRREKVLKMGVGQRKRQREKRERKDVDGCVLTEGYIPPEPASTSFFSTYVFMEHQGRAYL